MSNIYLRHCQDFLLKKTNKQTFKMYFVLVVYNAALVWKKKGKNNVFSLVKVYEQTFSVGYHLTFASENMKINKTENKIEQDKSN